MKYKNFYVSFFIYEVETRIGVGIIMADLLNCIAVLWPLFKICPFYW